MQPTIHAARPRPWTFYLLVVAAPLAGLALGFLQLRAVPSSRLWAMVTIVVHTILLLLMLRRDVRAQLLEP
jgi:hypothetical protein